MTKQPKGGSKEVPLLGVPGGYAKKHKSLKEIIEKKEKSEVIEIDEEQEEEEEEEVDHGPCVLCGIKDQNENEMLCDGCDRPFHNSCVGISDEELEIMIEAEEDWFCEDCVKSGKNKSGANKTQSEMRDEMREDKLKEMDRADSDFNLDARDEVEFIKGTRGNPSEEKKRKQEKKKASGQAPGPAPAEGVREVHPKDEETGETEELAPKPSPSKSVASKYKPGTQREAMMKKLKQIGKRR